MDLSGFNGVIMDLDGVLWKGENVVKGAPEKVNELKNKGIKVVFLTNNASKSRKNYLEKLWRLGFDASVDEIITSGYATAKYIRESYGESKVYAIGMDGLTNELALERHKLVDSNADVVAVGMDENFTYEKLKKGFKNIRNGAHLVACNDDAVGPREDDLVPAAGAIVKALEYCANVKAEVVGKPNKPIMDITLKKLGLRPDECVMVGDSIKTDIIAGKNFGLKTALLRSRLSDFESADSMEVAPDFVLNDISEIEVK